MKITCKKLLLKSLERVSEKIVFEKDDRTYIGPYFFELPSYYKILKVLKEEVIEEEDTIKGDIKAIRKIFGFYITNGNDENKTIALNNLERFEYIHNFSRYLIENNKFSLDKMERFIDGKIFSYQQITEDLYIYSVEDKYGILKRESLYKFTSLDKLKDFTINPIIKNSKTNKVIENLEEILDISLENIEVI